MISTLYSDIEHVMRHHISINNPSQSRSDTIDVSFDGRALFRRLIYNSSLCSGLRLVAGLSSVAVEFGELVLRAAMRGNEAARRVVPAQNSFPGLD